MKPNADQQPRTSIPDGLGYGNEPEPQEPTQEDVTGFDELDELSRDLDDITPSSDLDRNLGWDSDDEDPEEETTDTEEPADQPEEPEEETPEGEEPDELAEGEEPAEEPETEGEEEPEEEEVLYDSQRDFPDEDVQPTKYKDRVALNGGAAAKVHYARELVEQLEEMEASLGAIDLPEIFDGNEDFIKNPFDRNQFAEMDDDTAKKAVFEMDKFIKNVKNKVSRVEGEYNVTKEKEEVTQEYQSALDNLSGALDRTGISVNEASQLTNAQIVQRADKAIQDFKENKFDDVYTSKGVDEAYAQLQALQDAKRTIEEFPKVAGRYQEVAQKKAPQQQQVTPEQTESAFREWEADRPDLPIFNGKTDAEKRDFLEYTKLKMDKGEVRQPGTAREWHNIYQQHQADRQAEYKRYQASKDKSPKEPKPEEKKASAKDKKRPPVHKVRSSDQRLDRNELSTENIDNTLDDLAQEMDTTTP